MAGVWTRNFFNLLTALVLGDTNATNTGTPTDYTAPIRVRLSNGTYANVTSERPNIGMGTNFYRPYIDPGAIGKLPVEYGYDSAAYLNNYARICLGNGTTPSTYEDYAIESPITSGLTLVNSSGTLTTPSNYDANGHIYSSKRSFTLTNNTSSNITVSEFGIFLPNAQPNYSYATQSCLVYRDVFTPITLMPSESIVVEFERRGEVYNYTPY